MAGPSIVARLGLDAKEWDRGLIEAKRGTDKFVKGTKESFGSAGAEAGKAFARKFGLGDVLKSLMAGVGLASAEKAADAVARAYAGMSQETEDAYRRIEIASTRLADISIENARRTLSDEKKYQLLLKDREKILKNIPKEKGNWFDSVLTFASLTKGFGFGMGVGPMLGAGASAWLASRNDERQTQNTANSLEAQVSAAEKQQQADELREKMAKDQLAFAQKYSDAAAEAVKAGQDLATAKQDRSRFSSEDLAGVTAESGTSLGRAKMQEVKARNLDTMAAQRMQLGDLSGSEKFRNQADALRRTNTFLKSDERQPFKGMEDRLDKAIDKLKDLVEGQKGLIVPQ